jgi:D-sedoheptulose 7-phosphate isomerase
VIKKHAEEVINFIMPNRYRIYTFGNGGSASIADHMACDWMKFAEADLRIISLSSNGPLLSAIGNDLGYEETCAAQLRMLGLNHWDTLVLVSSSGTSQNIVYAATEAKRLGLALVSFTGNIKGSVGGPARALADVSVHCDSDDYGTVEDYHSQVMHEVARQLKALK